MSESDRAKHLLQEIINAIENISITGSGGGLTDAELRATPVPVSTPSDPFGANADAIVAAGAAGSIQAKLRRATQGLEDLKSLIVLAAGDNNIGNVDIASALPAGTNNIGDVDVASIAAGDNNIGNVDIVTVPRSQSGPGQPGTAVDSYTQAAINLSAGANQVLVSSAANKQIWVYGISFTLNVAGTVSFQDEDDTAVSGVMPFAASSGLAIPPSGNFSMPLWKLPTDKDLEVDLVTADMDGFIVYAIVSV